MGAIGHALLDIDQHMIKACILDFMDRTTRSTLPGLPGGQVLLRPQAPPAVDSTRCFKEIMRPAFDVQAVSLQADFPEL